MVGWRIQRLTLKTNNPEAGWRQLTAQYWGLVTQVDRSVGAILEHLDRVGLADDSIVVYTSDHGDMMGSHRLLAKTVMCEEAARVPWLMRIPSLGCTQRHIARPVSHIDLIPTLLELMQAEGQDDLPGQSLCPLLEGRPVAEAHVFMEWTPQHPSTPGRNPYGASREPLEGPSNDVRTAVSPEGWKLSIHTNDHNQLFNLRSDPGETTNVYDVPDNRAVIEGLAERIHTWQQATGDELELSVG